MKHLLSLLLFCIAFSGIQAQMCFSVMGNSPVGQIPKGITSGDFNGDGKMDVAAANQNDNNITVMLGNGNGTFGAPVTYSVNLAPQTLIAADFTADGILDLVTANYSSNDISIITGLGNGTFSSPTNFLTNGSNPQGLNFSDFNNDAKTDLVVTNYGASSGTTISIMLGDGAGGFPTVLNYTVGTGPVAADVRDLNADGNQDVVVANYNSNNVTVLMGTGSASFGAPTTYTAGTYPTAIDLDDINNDGLFDMLVTDAGSYDVFVFLGTGGGNFGAPSIIPTGAYPYYVITHDFNTDGKQEMAILNSSDNSVWIYPGNGNGTFGTAMSFTVGTAPYYMSLNDFTSDGKLDLITSNGSSNDVTLLAYAPLSVNAGPDETICANTYASLSGSSSATLQWSTLGTGSFSPNSISASCNYIPSTADITAGTVTVTITTGTVGSCPAVFDTMLITINPLPSISIAATSTAVCVGSLTSFAATGGINYSWIPSAGLSCQTCGTTNATVTVSTTYTVTGTDTQGCQDTASVFVLAKTDTLSGLVTDTSSNPVTAGKVYVFTRNYSHAGLLDTMGYTSIASGAYTFACLDTASYLIKVVADTVAYPTSVPTYYTNNPIKYEWDSAQVVTILNYNTNVTARDVQIIQLPAPGGPGTIIGRVRDTTGFGSRYGAGYAVSGAPLKGVDVKLGKNPGGQAAARTTTDAQGNFTFTNVPTGNYKIYVDVPNYPMDSILTVSITSGSPTSINNNYYIDSMKVYVDTTVKQSVSIKPISGASNINIYPNPTTAGFVIEAGSATSELQLFDVNGALVLSQVVSGITYIDVHQLPEGVYYVKLNTGQGILNKKLVIIR